MQVRGGRTKALFYLNSSPKFKNYTHFRYEKNNFSALSHKNPADSREFHGIVSRFYGRSDTFSGL